MTIALGGSGAAHAKWDTGTLGSGIDTTGCNLIVVFNTSFSTAVTFTDNKSNGTATQLTTQTSSASPISAISYWEHPAVGSGHTFTSSATTYGCFVAAFSGCASGTIFDQQNGVGNSAGSTIQPGALNAANDNSLFIAAVGALVNATASSDSSYSTIDAYAYGAGAHYQGALFYRIESGNAGSLNPTISLGGTSTANAHHATFNADNGGGGGGIFTPFFYHQHIARAA